MKTSFVEHIKNSINNFVMRIYLEDPVMHCKLYKEKGCSLVDSFKCNFPNCNANIKYISENDGVQ